MERVKVFGMLVLILLMLCAFPCVSAFASWQDYGNSICTATGTQDNPQITSDGAGGAIITWQDSRTGNVDIYAQRVDVSGNVMWTPDGVVVCMAMNNQYEPQIISDGTGGAIFAWYDLRSGASDIYAQRVNASGIMLWGLDGHPISTAPDNQWHPRLVPDGSGGAIITWQDIRTSTSRDIYAQRVDSLGLCLWVANGVSIRSNVGPEDNLPSIAADNMGGAIVCYCDQSYDVYAQRVDSMGTVQWRPGGVPICTAHGNQWNPQIISDGAGGGIITWLDNRGFDESPPSDVDIYAQRITSTGVILWVYDGAAVCRSSGSQQSPQITTDGQGGAVIAWVDPGLSAYAGDIHVQRIDSSGTALWATNGTNLCEAGGVQSSPRLSLSYSGNVIVTWKDARSGTYDIYALLAEHSKFTAAPSIAFVRDIPNDQGGSVALAWNHSNCDIVRGAVTYYSVWRALPAGIVSSIAETYGSSVTSDITEESTGARVRVTSNGMTQYYWELIGKVDAHRFSSYSLRAPTLFDSTSASGAYHSFLVSAHTSDPLMYWDSAPDSGYSVDNLAPDPPRLVSGRCVSGLGLLLSWSPNSEQDLSHYAIYKGLDSTFVPSEVSLIGTAADTSFVDGSYNLAVRVYYKLTAVDIHENQSRWTMWVGEGGPTVIYSPELAAGVNERGIKITWNALPGATGYQLYERKETEGAYVRITETSILPGPSTYVYVLSEYPEVTTYFMLSVLVPGGIEMRYGPVVVYPLRTAIVSCSPNPFSLSTQVQYSVASNIAGSLRIYDVTGRLVKTLHEGALARGTRSIVWDGSTDAGVRAAAGIYLLRFETEGFVESRKLALTRE